MSTTPPQNWSIRIVAIIAVVAGLLVAAFHQRIAYSIFGGTETWKRIAVLAIAGVVIAVALGIEKEARKRLKQR